MPRRQHRVEVDPDVLQDRADYLADEVRRAQADRDVEADRRRARALERRSWSTVRQTTLSPSLTRNRRAGRR